MPDVPNLTDSSLMRMAHPQRLNATMTDVFEELKQNWLGSEWPIIERYLKDERLVLAEAARLMTAKHSLPRLRAMSMEMAGLHGNTEMGGTFGMLSWLRFQLVKHTHFKFEDSLVELLENTDLDDDIPISYLLPPYPFNYLELGTKRDGTTFITNVQSGNHSLEGAYVERGAHHEHPDALFITLTGSPVGHEDAADDATMNMLLPLDDMEAPLSKVLLNAFHSVRTEAMASGLNLSSPESIPATLEALKLVAKALLYLGLPDARRTLRPEKSELIKAEKSLSSPAKKAKLRRKIAKAYDYVLVQAAPLPDKAPDGESGTGRTTKAHWRRGHFRMQAYGPKHSLRKMIHIPYTLVSGDNPQQERPTNYVVR